MNAGPVAGSLARRRPNAPAVLQVLSLIPTFLPRQGGAQMVLTAIAEGLRSRVASVVLTRGYADSPSFQAYGDFEVHRYPNPAPERWKDYATGAASVSFGEKVSVALLDVVGCVLPLLRLSRDADLVHVHFPLPLGLTAALLKCLVRRPLVVTVHGNADVYELPKALAPLTRAVLRRADTVVSVSHDLAEHLQQKLGVRRVTVIPNGVDTDAYRPAARAPSDTVTLVSISRIVPRKNIHVLIEAVERLAAEGEHRLRLLIAGTGPEEREIERLALASEGRTRFLGFVTEAEKRKLLQDADVFVQLSLREGLSIAALEALASGLPCVVSDLPGVREPVDPGETGFLVRDPERVEDVVATLRQLLAARPQLDAMKLAARRAAEERFSLRAMSESYFQVYCEAVARSEA